jgi:predicted ribosome quality control (RQC) complex YloA/Tae2 family protein
MNTAVPAMEERLNKLVNARADDVKTMHRRTTPWTDFEGDLNVPKRAPVSSKRRKGIGKIERVRSGEEEADDFATLAKFEQMADEVEEYLQDELARLERQIDLENLKRAVGFWSEWRVTCSLGRDPLPAAHTCRGPR